MIRRTILRHPTIRRRVGLGPPSESLTLYHGEYCNRMRKMWDAPWSLGFA